jgi:hypothetical protein
LPATPAWCGSWSATGGRCRSGAAPAACRRRCDARCAAATAAAAFPGCDRSRFVHAHHVRHWARGGRTDLSNLLQLCDFHHRLMHEGGYTIEPRTHGEVLFRRPDGRAVEPAPRRGPGDRHELRQQNRQAGLELDDTTCVPQVDFQRARIAWIVDGLAEADLPRLGD